VRDAERPHTSVSTNTLVPLFPYFKTPVPFLLPPCPPPFFVYINFPGPCRSPWATRWTIMAATLPFFFFFLLFCCHCRRITESEDCLFRPFLLFVSGPAHETVKSDDGIPFPFFPFLFPQRCWCRSLHVPFKERFPAKYSPLLVFLRDASTSDHLPISRYGTLSVSSILTKAVGIFFPLLVLAGCTAQRAAIFTCALPFFLLFDGHEEPFAFPVTLPFLLLPNKWV